MGELLKATLQDEDDSDSTAVPVQFNPASLKLRLQNQSDGGRSRGRQRRQHNGASSTVLSMDLIFDTADEGTDDAPVSVRTKTALVEKYVLPRENTSDAPPRVKFHWDQLIIVGIVESLDIEFDHFAANGSPLRAKLSLSIKEQDPAYTFAEGASGPAARTSDGATDAGGGENGAAEPGGGTNEPGNNNNNDRSDTALDGETAADFLARKGMDPSAWRGLSADLSAGLSLQAGIEVGFSASLNASVGVGVAVGVMADVGVSLEASLGMNETSVVVGSSTVNKQSTKKLSSAGAKKVNGDTAGIALAAVGGVQSAIETVKIKQTRHAASAAEDAFTRPSAASSAEDTQSGGSRVSQLPTADPRSTSYGFGVPLRSLFPSTPPQGEVRLCGVSNSAIRSDGGPAFRKQKSTPAWEALPKRDRLRSIADKAEARRQQHPCEHIYHPCSCN